jgi:hypothetical protein
LPEQLQNLPESLLPNQKAKPKPKSHLFRRDREKLFKF